MSPAILDNTYRVSTLAETFPVRIPTSWGLPVFKVSFKVTALKQLPKDCLMQES